jgi:predicted ATPase/class 3 adenylate cyclase
MQIELATGTVTFLFTDIQGSTPLWEQMPEEMQASVAQHHTILRQAIESNGGTVYQIIGDGFQASFRLASEGLSAALAAQRALQLAEWYVTGPLKVRMGLHTGQAELDRLGNAPYEVSHTLNRAGRVMSAGHGGQILLSQETADLVARQLPREVTLKDLGEYRLKGMTIPEHLYQVVAPDLPSSFPPLATAIAHPNNLPVQLTSFIGREADIAAVCARLQNPGLRLLTITGVGGSGKTRLAIRVGQELLEEYPEGIYFVNLTPLRESTLVVAAVARIFSLHATSSHTIMEVLCEFLFYKKMLLILDNFEQVISSGPDLNLLLAAAPGVKLLVTSRELLRISGEHNYPLSPFMLPSLQDAQEIESLSQNEAIRLFVERARSVQPEFYLSLGNATPVIEICRRLDGLPLAIELAAARVRLLTPQNMLEQFSSRLKLLVGGARDLPVRHQTMRLAIEWSYDLLSEPEKALFCRLGVFAGGCTLEAADAVCKSTMDILEGIESLLYKNLLRRTEMNGQTRFWMYETIREFALEQLDASHDSLETHRAMAHYFSKSDFLNNLKGMERELDNLRAVLRWSIDSGEARAGLLIAGQPYFWNKHAAEGRRWLKELLDSPGAREPTEDRMNGLGGALALAFFDGDLEATEAYLREAFVLARALQLERHPAFNMFHFMRGWLEFCYGHYPAAAQEFQIYYQKQVESSGKDSTAYVCHGLAACELMTGNLTKAREYYQAAVDICQRTNDKVGICESKARLAFTVLEEGHLDEAEQLLRESIQVAHEIGYDVMNYVFLRGIGRVAWKRGQVERAVRLYGTAEQVGILQGSTQEFAELELLSKRYLDEMRQQTDPAVFERAWKAGRSMTPGQAIEYALNEKLNKESAS